MQDIQMIEWLMHYANAFEIAVAKYANGKVNGVIIAKRKIFCLDDYKILRAWLRYRNVQREAVWIRPSITQHSLLLLDDLPITYAIHNMQNTKSIIIETSPGNTQVWIATDRSIRADDRRLLLKKLSIQHNTDRAAVTDPRFGRLAGFKSAKNEQHWTNIIRLNDGDPLNTKALLESTPHPPQRGGEIVREGLYVAVRGTKHCSLLSAQRDDVSKREFAYACHALRAGLQKDEVIRRIEEHVRLTKRRKAKDYARRTVEAAQKALLTF